jgi:uncharacterized membrane protein YfcA
VLVPALVYFARFRPRHATGTSLAVLLPPIGLGAAWVYYPPGDVHVRAATITAVAVLAGGWVVARLANRMSGLHVRVAFSALVIYLLLEALHGLD